MNFENFLNKPRSRHNKLSQDLAQKQSDLDRAKIDDLELALRAASLPSLPSPVPNTNLMPAITGAVPIDENRLNDALSALSLEFDGRLNILSQQITALIGSSVGNILPVVPVPTGPQNLSFNLAACQSNAKASQCQVEPELSQSVLNKSRDPAQPILTCGSEYNISYPPQTINNVPAESTSPSSSQRADREQASTQAPRIERVGENSNENTPNSPPQTEYIVKRRPETKRGRVRFNNTWSRDNCCQTILYLYKH
jgi:hypothetical protein